jgi:hypothetical protein
MQSREELIERIQVIHQRLTEMVLIAGLKKTTWERLLAKLEERNLSTLRMIEGGLIKFETSGYKDFIKVYNMPQTGKDFWDNMAAATTVLPEHRKFRSAAKSLRDSFNFWVRDTIKDGPSTTETDEGTGAKDKGSDS